MIKQKKKILTKIIPVLKEKPSLRERLKIRNSNLTKLIDENNGKKINYPKAKKRKKILFQQGRKGYK